MHITKQDGTVRAVFKGEVLPFWMGDAEEADGPPNLLNVWLGAGRPQGRQGGGHEGAEPDEEGPREENLGDENDASNTEKESPLST